MAGVGQSAPSAANSHPDRLTPSIGVLPRLMLADALGAASGVGAGAGVGDALGVGAGGGAWTGLLAAAGDAVGPVTATGAAEVVAAPPPPQADKPSAQRAVASTRETPGCRCMIGSSAWVAKREEAASSRTSCPYGEQGLMNRPNDPYGRLSHVNNCYRETLTRSSSTWASIGQRRGNPGFLRHRLHNCK